MIQESITYKSSGIDWLGDIPSHWEIVRFRNVFDYISRGDTPSYADSSRIKIINQSCVQHLNLLLENVKYNVETDISDYKGRVQKNDLLINSTGTGTLGRIGIFDRDNDNEFFVDSHVTILRSSNPDVFPKFYYYFLANKQELITALASEGATNQIELQREKLRSLCVPLPPLQEQIAVVDHLEGKLKEVEDFLSQKQRFIDLLREQKQAIINEAVTKGIYRQNNDSYPVTQGNYHYSDDAPWLESVPGHWEVLQLKRVLSRIDYGLSESSEDEGDYKFLNMGHIQDGKVVLQNTGFLKHVPQDLLLCNDDLLYNRTNSAELVAKVGIFQSADENVTFASYLVRLRANQEVIPKYLCYYLNNAGFIGFARSQALLSINQANLNPTRYTQLKIALPPLVEQAEIVAYIEDETGRIDGLIDIAKRQVASMHEYRSALVAEVVTGKAR